MKKLLDIRNNIKEGNFGFQIEEVMTGEHVFEPGMGPEGTHHFEFKVSWGPEDFLSWINPQSHNFLTHPLHGTITAGGLCHQVPCQGSMKLAYFSEQKIRYNFDFQVGGTEYQYLGEKVNIWPWNLPFSHTTCFGTVVEKETGKLISRSVTYFKIHTTPSFLASFRLVPGEC